MPWTNTQHGTNQIYPNLNSNQNHSGSSTTLETLCQIHFALAIPFTLQNLGPSPALCFGLHLHGLINGELNEGSRGPSVTPIRCGLLDGGRRDDILDGQKQFFWHFCCIKVRDSENIIYVSKCGPVFHIKVNKTHLLQRDTPQSLETTELAPHTPCTGPESRSVALQCPTRELPRSPHAQ